MKKYIAKSCISISAPMENGNSIHVAFQPVTGGGSIFYTDDEVVAAALERHHQYGKLFKRDTDFDQHVTRTAQNSEAGKTDKPDEDSDKLTQINVTCPDDAKEYLCDKYGVSRTKLKSKKAIIDTAANFGIEFVGL